MFSRHPEAIKSQNYLISHVVFIQHGEICIEAIENARHQCLATGRGKEPDWIFYGFCILNSIWLNFGIFYSVALFEKVVVSEACRTNYANYSCHWALKG